MAERKLSLEVALESNTPQMVLSAMQAAVVYGEGQYTRNVIKLRDFCGTELYRTVQHRGE